MYISKMLIKYQIKWIRGLRPENPRRTIWCAVGKVVLMHELNMIDDAEYEDLYTHVMNCLRKSGAAVDDGPSDDEKAGE